MAISDNTRNKFNQTRNSTYQESDETKRRRLQAQELMNSRPQERNNTFAGQISDIYNKIKSRKDFSYDPANDKLYQQYAATYKALGDLAMTQTADAAQGLTGGYGSTYSPAVAAQTDNAYQNEVDKALPQYYQMAQELYNAYGDMLNNQLSAAIYGAGREDESYLNQLNAWNEAAGAAGSAANQDAANEQQAYSDWRNLWAEQYWEEQEAQNDAQELAQSNKWNANELKEDNRQFSKELNTTKTENQRSEKWEKYDQNQTIAASKCADYNEKGDNKGMKSYLDKQVKNGNITQYMADELYSKYKYTAPKSSSSGSAKSSGSTAKVSVDDNVTGGDSGSNSNDTTPTPKIEIPSGINKNWLHTISMYRDKTGRVQKICDFYDKGEASEEQANWLLSYYGFSEKISDLKKK